jgi:hypothetical protein
MNTLWQQEIDKPPPERHADRVIAAMLRDLAKKRAAIAPAIMKAVDGSRDGGPRAQNRLKKRVENAGAIHVELHTGTRGRYELYFFEIVGWDPIVDKEIGVNNEIPEKPWLAVVLTGITNRGRDVTTFPVLFVTHHSLSRAAQRFKLRTAEHIVNATRNIWAKTTDSDSLQRMLQHEPPQGHHIEIGRIDGVGITAVLRKHETHATTMIVTTMKWTDGGPQPPETQPVTTARI